MISRLRGEVLEVTLDHAVVGVGGVGLTVHTTPGVLAELARGQRADLATVLLVREDSLTLYGFTDPAARELFVALQTVAGIGPRVGLATLAVLSPTELNRALSGGDTAMLTRVPGIGRKGAERMIIELGDRVTPTTTGPAGSPAASPHTGGVTSAGSGGGADRGRAQVVEALIGLGFAARQAEQAVTTVTAEGAGVAADTGETSIDPGRTLRAALHHLSRHR